MISSHMWRRIAGTSLSSGFKKLPQQSARYVYEPLLIDEMRLSSCFTIGLSCSVKLVKLAMSDRSSGAFTLTNNTCFRLFTWDERFKSDISSTRLLLAVLFKIQPPISVSVHHVECPVGVRQPHLNLCSKTTVRSSDSREKSTWVNSMGRTATKVHARVCDRMRQPQQL